MGLDRRAFLQQASLALGALGLGGSALLGAADYAQALGKPARRKLALLIGINQYPERAIDSISTQDSALKGCLTDVELQRQLLIHRFGFAPEDILVLTNAEATRARILAAIESHLVQQAQGDDGVLLHFSGYGSQVRLAHDPSRIHLAWVPVDSRLPSEERPAFGDVLEAEVVALLRQLKTANLTTVVDAGFQDTGYLRWGNLKVRSRPTVPTGTLPTAETPDSLAAIPPWPGVLLRAGTPGTLVLEEQWDGFSAGAFTYLLTQSLWETNPDATPRGLVQRVGDRLQRWTGPEQHPTLGNAMPLKSPILPYGLSPVIAQADGMTLPAADGRSLDLWLGGVLPEALPYLQPGTRFVTAIASGSPPDDPPQTLELRLDSRTGLRGQAKPVIPGVALPSRPQPLYETVRLLPQSIALVVALDAQLKRVERVDATSALAGLPFVSATTAGERHADCLFGRLPVGPVTTLTAALPYAAEATPLPKGSDRLSESSYGLFAPNRTLVPGTMLPKDEAVKTAISRLTPTLRAILALKLLRLTQNRAASGLGVTVALESLRPSTKALLRQQTERSGPNSLLPPSQVDSASTLALSRDTRFLYRVTNRSDQPLYILVVRFDSQGDCSARVVFPDESPADGVLADLPPVLAPRQTQVIPNTPNGWGILGSVTSVETHLVLSDRPFRHCLEVMAVDGAINPLETDLRRVSQPLKLAQALLQDLHSDTGDRAATDVYALSHDRWATFNFGYTINAV